MEVGVCTMAIYKGVIGVCRLDSSCSTGGGDWSHAKCS